MKTSIHAVLSVFFAVALITLASCNPKQAAAEPATPSTAGTPAAGGAGPTAVSAGGTAADLAAFGFHVFPEPVELPEFTVKALAGADLKSSGLTGTLTILNFWATWCPPCKREMPSIQRLADKMKGGDFRIVAVSTGEKRSTVEDFIKQNKYDFPVYLDENGSLGASFASQGIPTTYILDKSGRIIAGIVGSREYDEPAFVAVLEGLAAK